jgi:hypothetical protein
MKKHSITINQIVCIGTAEVGDDDVFLRCQADAGITIRYPFSPNDIQKMNSHEKSKWNLDLELNFDYEVLVTLWDQDAEIAPGLATYLQSQDFLPGTGRGNTSTLTNLNGAKYVIYYTYNS